MSLNILISKDVPQVTTGDSIEYIQSLFFASKLEHLPMVDLENHYLGVLDVGDFQELVPESDIVEPYLYEDLRPFIGIHAHPFEALRLVHLHDIDILPVLLEDGEYAGAVKKTDLVNFLIDNVGIDVNGGIIVLEVAPRDYSLSQIARICENEQVQILGLSVKTNLETEKMEITLKTNSTYLSAAVQAFERFEYNVVATYGDTTLHTDNDDRYRLLMNYINM